VHHFLVRIESEHLGGADASATGESRDFVGVQEVHRAFCRSNPKVSVAGLLSVGGGNSYNLLDPTEPQRIAWSMTLNAITALIDGEVFKSIGLFVITGHL